MKSTFLKTVSLLTAFILIISACNYYKVMLAKTGDGTATYSVIDSLKNMNRYFILRHNEMAFYMKQLELSKDQRSVSCTLEYLPANHLFSSQKGNYSKKYRKSDPDQSEIVNEVHFYIKDSSKLQPGSFTLQLEEIEKIEMIQHDKKRTTNSYVIGTVVTVLGTAALAGIIALALKTSCPFVSAYDGKDFSLQGEIYGGAIYPQLSRKDYLPLKMAPLADGTLQLKISNELKENQFTDLARLWVVSHDKGTKIASDEKGNLYNIVQPLLPFSAILNQHKNILPEIRMADDYKIVYMEDTSRKDALNEIILKFKKPLHSKKAKLLLTLKNTYFLDLLYGELAMGLGNYYNSFVKLQKKKSADELLKWVKNQSIPMMVSVNTVSGWKNQASITTIGPLAFRETVVAIDLSSVYSDEVEIKLSSGFMFWEIDQASIDFSANEFIKLEKLNPISAIDENSNDVLPALSNEDAVYLSQPVIGNVATLVYKPTVKPSATIQQTYILETKGYYEHIRSFQHEPDFSFLKQFRKPGAFPAYGVKLYKKAKIEMMNSMARKN